MSLLTHPQPQRRFRHLRRQLPRRRLRSTWTSTRANCSPSSAKAGPGKSVTMLALMGLLALDRDGDRRRDDLRRPRPARHRRAHPPPDHRQGPGDDLPGTDVLAEPLLPGRLADQGSAALPPRHGPRPAPQARHRAVRTGRHPRPRKAPVGLPAPDVGRHEPAGDDRHGDRLQAQAADRRRADHGAGRDDPGADPRSADRPASTRPAWGWC